MKHAGKSYYMGLIALHPVNPNLAYFKYRYTQYVIFYYPLGVNTNILTRVFEQIDVMLSYFSKVRVVLLQLNFSQQKKELCLSGNKYISVCMQSIIDEISPLYGNTVGYLWVREKVKSDSPHYHIALMVNGHKCKSAYHIQNIAQKCWHELTGGSHWNVDKPTYCIRRNNDTESREARARISYLAKNQTKESNKQSRCFSSSRLKVNPKAKFKM